LCDASDYIAANCHPYFDGGVAAPSAGQWVVQQANSLRGICGKDVLITGTLPILSWINTETGWPSAGDPNGDAVPSKANQLIAKNSLLSALGNKVVLFSAFDDLWKNPGPYDVEQNWVFVS
jgi:exo-beta-1,3-glucanase (GH17 family)